MPRQREGGEHTGSRRSIRLPSEVESVPVGRAWLRERLGDGHPALGNAVQALSEVLTNAVLYGDGLHVRLVCEVAEGHVEVAVHNGRGPDGDVPCKQGADGELRESGRGLVLVEAFADEWGAAETADEVCVWFRVCGP